MENQKAYKLQKNRFDIPYFMDDDQLMSQEEYVVGKYVKYSASDVQRFNIQPYEGADHYSVSYGILLAMSKECKQMAYFEFDQDKWIQSH